MLVVHTPIIRRFYTNSNVLSEKGQILKNDTHKTFSLDESLFTYIPDDYSNLKIMRKLFSQVKQLIYVQKAEKWMYNIFDSNSISPNKSYVSEKDKRPKIIGRIKDVI